LPAQGGTFDPDTLIDARLVISVENKEKEGTTYSNVVDFFPSKESKKVQTSAGINVQASGGIATPSKKEPQPPDSILYDDDSDLDAYFDN